MCKSLILVCVLLFSGGCATMEVRDADSVYPAATVAATTPADEGGVYHKVHRGETIWRIAKAYNAEVDDIIQKNNIPDVAQIEENQLVFIPGADQVREVAVEPKGGESNDFIWPIKGKVINYFNQAAGNKGIDIKAASGQLVKASRSGRVVLADYLTGYGYTVIVNHTDGYYTVYVRNAEVDVAVNDYVHQGDAIAKLGRSNSGTYLHFEIRKNAAERNPLHYLP